MYARWRTWAIAASVGCGDDQLPPDAPSPSAPVFRNPVALADPELARQALQILGAEVPGARTGSCSTCHGLTAERLSYWGALSDTAFATCLTDLAVSSPESARAMLDCVRAMPALPGSDFQARKLGVFTSAARLPWFAYTFEVAYGAKAAAELTAFDGLAAMPRGPGSFTQVEFDIVAEWFVRGLPALAQTLVVDPPPDSCVPAISSAVGDHTTAMATQGWRALDASLAMHDVDDAPLAVDRPFGAGWEVAGRGRLRVLRDVAYTTSFWTRSSADGRFVASGVADIPGSLVIDLQRDVELPIDAQYDPAFFPDHSGFMFQGGPRNTCPIGVLTSNPTSISMTEPGCRAIDEIGLYQHVGALLGGGDHFALDALFVSDDGGKLPTLSDPLASFVASARSSFTPLMFDGTSYVPRARVEVATPFEGDTVLSPSTTLTISVVPVMARPDTGRMAFMSLNGWTPGGGRASADAHCANEATTAGLTGHFLAAIATTTEPIKSRFPASEIYRRVDGVRVLRGPGLFTADFLDVPPELDQFGDVVSNDFWTGSTRLDAMPIAAENCDDWTDGSGGAQGVMHWTTSTDYRNPIKTDSCDSAFPVLCLEN